jgi:hypothetical protein
MSACGRLGALQEHGTCWFYTILNGFLMSEAGRKVLWYHMARFYKTLSAKNKAFFSDTMDAPCPMKGKVNKLYFYKFLDQYMCMVNEKSNLNPAVAHAHSAKLLKNFEFQGAAAKAKLGMNGANEMAEISGVLDRIGIDGVAKNYRHDLDMPVWFPAALKKKKVVIVSKRDRNPKFEQDAPRRITCRGGGTFVLSHASLHMWFAGLPGNTPMSHVISASICSGKGFVFDSNDPIVRKCKWWKWSELEKMLTKIGLSYFKHFGAVTQSGISYLVYVNEKFLKKIHPVCRMRVARTEPAHITAAKRILNTITRKVLNENARFKYIDNKVAAKNENVLREYVRSTPTLAAVKSKMASIPTKTARATYYSTVWRRLVIHDRRKLKLYMSTLA